MIFNVAEACQAVGHKGHMPLMNQIKGGYMSPSKYTPDEKILDTPLKIRHHPLVWCREVWF
jgi:hypothetical protein